ncbi:hypothetical protein Q9Q99_11085 [Curtobacterium flaccumfaciens]|nr:hypothetical protein Q9Q99_11085 [Curtobacterium flaccumfaciens]
MSDPGISPVDDFDSQQRRDDDIDREHVGPYEVDEAEESLGDRHERRGRR